MLLCISADYKADALIKLAQNPNDRQEAIGNLCEAAGAKLVTMYGRMTNGPGTMVVIDAPPLTGPAICAAIAASGAFQNVRMERLFTMDEVSQIRQKRIEISGAFRPGQ